jgi:hypothetical protein
MNYLFSAIRYEAGAIKRIPESTILIPTTDLYNPSSWMRSGDSPSEIILAMAIFVGILSKRR